MLSQDAYRVAAVLVRCPSTVHDLKFSAAVSHWPMAYRNQALWDALTELSGRGFVEWTLEPNYPVESPQARREFNADALRRDWRACFGTLGPRPASNEPTLFVYVTDQLLDEMDRSEYTYLYAPDQLAV